MESESNTDTETSRCGVWTPCPAEVNQSEPADFDLDIRLSPTRPQTSVLKLIEWNEIPHKRSGQAYIQSMVSAYAGQFMPGLKENVLLNSERNCPALDKAFASTWTDNATVVVGTKCNRLLCIDVHSSRAKQIVLPKLKEDKDIASGHPCCAGGIHGVSTNLTKTLLASSGSNCNNLTVFELPTFRAVSTFVGHKDWIFSTAWIDNTHIVTASRDKTLRVWNTCPMGSQSFGRGNVAQDVCYWHGDRVRDVKFDGESRCASSVSIDGHLVIWDPLSMEVVRNVHLMEDKSVELACLAMQNNVIATGSERHVSLVDVRCRGVKYVSLPRHDSGLFGTCARSLSFRDGILTIGGGSGKIMFYDLRMGKFLATPKVRSSNEKSIHLQTSQGIWHPRDMEFFRDFGHLDEGDFKPSIYTHSWDPTGLRLFVGGGPAFLVARGCYMSVWS